MWLNLFTAFVLLNGFVLIGSEIVGWWVSERNRRRSGSNNFGSGDVRALAFMVSLVFLTLMMLSCIGGIVSGEFLD